MEQKEVKRMKKKNSNRSFRKNKDMAAYFMADASRKARIKTNEKMQKRAKEVGA